MGELWVNKFNIYILLLDLNFFILSQLNIPDMILYMIQCIFSK